MRAIWHTLFSTLLFAFASSTTIKEADPSFPVIPHLIHEFPLKTYLHSLAVRKQDGDILVTVATSAQIFLVSTTNEFEPIEVATLPGVTSAVGIIETCIDEFYVVGGNLSVTDKTAQKGTFSVWKLDMRHGVHNAPLKEVANFPEGLLLDRIMQWNEHTLFISDSILGVIWSLDIHSGKISVVLNDTATMSPISQSGVGLNYLRHLKGFIYYDNSERGEISRIPVDKRTGAVTGPAEVLIKDKGDLFPQGFAFRGDDMWLANAFNQVMLLPDVSSGTAGNASLEVVAGNVNDTRFAGLTDCKFGTKAQDVERGSLYVSSIGKVGDDYVTPASIWRLDVGSTH